MFKLSSVSSCICIILGTLGLSFAHLLCLTCPLFMKKASIRWTMGRPHSKCLATRIMRSITLGVQLSVLLSSFMVDLLLGPLPLVKLSLLLRAKLVNAATAVAKDAIHLKNLLVELGQMPKDFPIRIAEDNSAAIAQAEAGLAHIRNAKHYAVRLRFLQQLVLDKEVEFVYTPTDEQLADFMTKPLDVTKFQRFRDMLLSVVG